MQYVCQFQAGLCVRNGYDLKSVSSGQISVNFLDSHGDGLNNKSKCGHIWFNFYLYFLVFWERVLDEIK